MSGEIIHRVVENYAEVIVPEGQTTCPRCKGKGKMSKYDEGVRSLVHEPGLAALRTCWRCDGYGFVPEERQ